jgi:predicted enzyme related to lactoylglutathione lyase
MATYQSTRDVIVRTADFDAAVSFYEHVLHLRVTMRRDGLVGFETGAFQLFVERGTPAHGPVFEMKVDNVAAARDRLVAAGCTLVEENPELPRCYLRDPYGFVFNLDN